jgi:hypothetical protein
MDATLATDVLNEALEKYPKPKIFNSDQGSQYKMPLNFRTYFYTFLKTFVNKPFLTSIVPCFS